MGLSVRIDDVSDYVAIKAAGPYSLTDLSALFDRLKEEAEKHNYRQALVDISEVQGSIPVLEMHTLAEHCSKVVGPGIRIAIVWQKGNIASFFENVARNRGSLVVVLGTQDAALEWLNR